VNTNWERIKAQKPGVIVIELLDAEKMGGKEGKGLSPEVAKAVVKKAHKADLQVFAKVENVSDIRLAVKLGIDGIAGLPGYDWNGQGSTAAFDLTEADLKLLAKKKTIIIPVFTHAQQMGLPKPEVHSFQAGLLRRMLASGVRVVVGSDDPQRTIRTEVTYWFNFGDLNPSVALRTFCETTPQAIFPDRKIGRIDNGYEASFLVLEDNPLNNLLKMRAIRFKVKNGVLLK
jgi:imidazolonepropionase-like amidohydrolase